jgi:hypothetical protein
VARCSVAINDLAHTVRRLIGLRVAAPEEASLVPLRLRSVKAFDERDIRSKHPRCSHDLDALRIAGMGAAIARPFIANNRAVSDYA